MIRHWWKILSALLLLTSLYFGFITPLAPGVASVSNEKLEVGQNNISIYGYNSNFSSDDESLVAWLKSGSALLCFDDFQVVNPRQIDASITIPDSLESRSMHLFIYSNQSDTIVLQNAFRAEEAVRVNKTTSCTITTENNASATFAFPYREMLYETIRNLFLHVPMWFAMVAIMLISVFYSIKNLSSGNLVHDIVAKEAVVVGLMFGVLGLITGSIWAKFTWGSWWVFQDIKLNGAAISTLMYLAYLILRNSIDDEQKRAKVSGVYNIFAFVMFIVFIGVVPRLKGSESLHPGNGGNPAFSNYDLDNSLKLIFYPAVLGWILLGVWIVNLRVRIQKLKEHIEK
jgi:heme exporter protein C